MGGHAGVRAQHCLSCVDSCIGESTGVDAVELVECQDERGHEVSVTRAWLEGLGHCRAAVRCAAEGGDEVAQGNGVELTRSAVRPHAEGRENDARCVIDAAQVRCCETEHRRHDWHRDWRGPRHPGEPLKLGIAIATAAEHHRHHIFEACRVRNVSARRDEELVEDGVVVAVFGDGEGRGRAAQVPGLAA